MSTETTFPFVRSASVLSVYSILLLFAALFVPRTSLLIVPLPPQASSRDRPQHPFLHPLTADPTLTLAWLCAGAAVLQPWWASWLRLWWREGELARAAGYSGDAAKDDVQRRIESIEGKGQKLRALKDAVMTTLAASIALYVVLILFGAPITSLFVRTYLLGLLLSLLVVYPSIYTLGIPSFGSDTSALVHRLMWIRLFAELSPRTPHERMLLYPTIGALLGAWTGAFPIPLDWDRPWQAWPLTPAYGAIAGYILAAWCALIVSGTYFLADADIRHIASESATLQPAALTGKVKEAAKKKAKARGKAETKKTA